MSSADLVHRYGFGVSVVTFDEGPDITLKFLGRGVDAALQLIAGEFCEPSFDLVEPRCRCWREMDMVVWPASDLGGGDRLRR
jgi:hypothetical protein